MHNKDIHNLCIRHYYGDQIKEYVIGGACSIDGRDKKCRQIFNWRI
jgi:hypothetical protein